MARGRILSKKISLNRVVNSLSNDTSRLAFTWTIAHLDSRGCIHGDPLVLKSIVFPRRTDITTDMMRSFITEWVKEKLVVWYEVNGELWLQLPKFKENQPGLRDEREADSGFPSPKEGKIVELAPDLPFKEESERVITTDDILGITPAPDLLRQSSGNHPDLLRQPSGNHPEVLRSDPGVSAAEFNISEFNIIPPPPAVAASPPLKINKKSTKTTTGPPEESPDLEKDKSPPFDAFNLFCRINDWISETDGLYVPVEKPGEGAKEWGFLKRMAAKIRSPDLVVEVFELLHQKGKLKEGFVTSWMHKEIEICLEEIDKETRAWG